MGTKVASLEIEMAANIARLTEDFAAARAEVNKSVGEIQRSVQRMQADVQASMAKVGESLKYVQEAFLAVGAALAGGAAIKGAVDKSVEMTREANHMAKAFGISATEASVLNVALGDVYVSGDTMLAANKALTKELLNNEGAFKGLGVATRDQNGNYRNSLDIMLDVSKRLLDFKEGTDRNIEGAKVYGKAWGEVQGVLKLNTDLMEASRAKAQELRLVVGQENVAATDRYRAAMNDVGDVIDAVRKAIGDAMLPILSQLGEWFSSIGPQSVQVMKASMGVLGEAINGVVLALRELMSIAGDVFGVVGNSVKQAFDQESLSGMQLFINMTQVVRVAIASLASGFAQMVEAARAAAVVLNYVLVGNLSKVDDTLQESASRLAKMRDEYVKTVDEIVLGSQVAAPTIRREGGARSDGKDEKEKKAKAAPSRMGEWEAALGDMKIAYQKENDLREMDLAQERKFWQDKLHLHGLSQQEKLALQRKVNQLELEELKKAHKERQQLSQMEVEERQRIELHGLDLKRQQYALARQMGVIGATEEIQALRQLEEEKYRIELKAAEDRAVLVKTDPVQYQQALDKIAQLKRQHDLEMAKNSAALAVEQKKEFDQLFAPITSAFEKSVNGMIQGTLTFRNAMRNMMQSIVLEFSNMGVKMAVDWARTQMLKTQASAAGAAARTGIETAAAAQSTAISAGASLKSILNSAAEVMANVYKSISAIPVVGPFMAPAMAVGAGAVVAGFAGNIMSASGGYDIPAGVNPMTQLHQNEMVLPAHIANPLRDMIANNQPGGGSTQTSIHLNVQAWDSRDVGRFLQDNKRHIATALKSASRDGFRA